AAFSGLAPDGTMVVVGVGPGNLSIDPMVLIMVRRRFIGSPAGSRKDLREALAFAGAHGLRPKTRRFPLAQAGEALAGMQTGHMTGRAVLIAAGCPLSVGLQLGPYRISGSSVSGRRHGAGLECVSQKCLGEFA
ncbi:MAG: hypothetical protein DMG72_14890, partial [Acidobacteria bacterium]